MVTRTQSLWQGTHHIRRFPALSRELDVDVAIIGGGITGVTAAVLLARAGRRVALIEHDRMGAAETGHTTSHLTEAVDARYQTLRRDFGEAGARLVAQASRDAIERIERFAGELSLQCGFERLPGYLYSERDADVRLLANELDAAVRAGCIAEWVDRVPLPFATAGGVCFTQQAQLHATAYLAGLIEDAVAHGVRIVEETRATNVHDATAGAPCIVHTSRFDVRAQDVFVAANVPINNRVLLHAKIAAYRSYAIAAELSEPDLHGLFWDTDDPYHYTRVQEAAGRQYLIVGGEDHRTGMETDTDNHYARLAAYMEDRVGSLPIRYRWSGQIIEPVDGLPFIGLNSGSTHVYVATGYAGNGITFGTLAAMLVSDRILGRENPYARVFDATRVKPLASAYDFVAENAVFPAHLAADRLTPLDVEPRAPQALGVGEGGIFTGAGDQGEATRGKGDRRSVKLAICRDRLGTLHACSAVCTHLGCDVAWNNAEQTWDCACHGSRFSPDGKVINGPAVSDLTPARIPTVS